jgi:hypothetical protein
MELDKITRFEFDGNTYCLLYNITAMIEMGMDLTNAYQADWLKGGSAEDMAMLYKAGEVLSRQGAAAMRLIGGSDCPIMDAKTIPVLAEPFDLIRLRGAVMGAMFRRLPKIDDGKDAREAEGQGA